MPVTFAKVVSWIRIWANHESEIQDPMIPRTLQIVLTGFLLALPAQALAQKIGEVPRVPPSLQAEKGTPLEWVSSSGQPYWYRLPAKIDARKPPNLVILLHGTGMKWGWAFWNYPIGSNRFRRDDICIAPEGMTPGQNGTFNFIQGEKDGQQIASLIQDFRGRFPVGNVYIYGHSQGAFFSYWFAGEYPELVDGIVAHAGNLLRVKHGDLARKQVAIGILHGEADAVVPVSLARRTFKIYQDEKYEKLKLEIVEGLTAKSGHWPLPKQVGEMLDWLDEVSVSTPGEELEVAISELSKPGPDLLTISGAIERASTGLRRYRGGDRKELQERIETIGEFLESLAEKHVERVEAARKDAKKGEPASWMGHLISVQAALRKTSKGLKALRKHLGTAVREDRLVAQAARMLQDRPGRGSFAQALKVVEKATVSADVDGLLSLLEEFAKESSSGATAEDRERLEKIAAARRQAIEAGRQEASEITAEAAGAFRKLHPELFQGLKS